MDADRQSQEMGSATLLDCRWAGGCGAAEGWMVHHLPVSSLCCPGLCRAPGRSSRRVAWPGIRQAADVAAPLQTGASGLERILRLRSRIALPAHSAYCPAHRMIPPAGRKADRPDGSCRVPSGQCAAVASLFGGVPDESTEVFPPTAATRMAAVSLGSSHRRRNRCEHCLCLFATANLLNLRLRRQWAPSATGESAA